jgi:hypothetical protein
MPEETIWPSTANVFIVTAFVVVLTLYIASDIAITKAKITESFERVKEKHIAHLAGHCLSSANNYIEITDEMAAEDALKKCRIKAKVIITDSASGKTTELNRNWWGNKNHEIAVLIKSGKDINPGWLRVEF